jgi:hypothetical protein
MEVSKKEGILISWFLWQFYEMPKFLFGVWNNYFVFASDIFSVPLLLKTLFSPWRKYKWQYPKGFNLGEFFSTFISNIFSRIIGACMRIVLIVIGILFQIFIAVIGLIIFIGWILIPFIIILGFLFILFIY